MDLNTGHTSKSHSGQVANKTVTIGNADKQGRQHYHFLYPYNVSLILTRLAKRMYVYVYIVVEMTLNMAK